MRILLFAYLIPAIIVTRLALTDEKELDEHFDSPRLAALAKQLTGDVPKDRAAVDKLWNERAGRGPLVEPIPDDSHSYWVTFMWRGDPSTRRVNVQGGPGTAECVGWLKALGNTGIWYRTERIPSDARFAYFFQVNRPRTYPPGADQQRPLAPPRPDPLNPRTLPSGDASLLELPAAPQQPWLDRAPGVPRGELYEHSLFSEVLKQERKFTVYTPPDYAASGDACRILVLFDGEFFQSTDQIPGPTILDNLISQRKVSPLVTVFVNQINRDLELGCSQSFADFTAAELVPWMRKHYHVSDDPANAIFGGVSRGGLMAAFCGLRHSEVFGNVLSLSGSYWWSPGADDQPPPPNLETGWLTRQFVTAPSLPVRFFLAAGRFEHYYPWSLRAENRRFRDVLEAKGHEVSYLEFSGGHDFICWRTPFAEGLKELAAPTIAVPE